MMRSINGKDNAPVDEQVEDLRERMRLLQGDRKANIDILEANKNANKEEIKRMREENKELRVRLSSVQRGSSSKAQNEEMDHTQKNVDRLRREYDNLKAKSQNSRKSLEGLKDDVKDLELEAKRPTEEDSPQTRKIRMLENRLDKAMIKYNEAQSIRKTYEQIVKRLKEERVGFDNQLASIERALGAKQKDYEELLLLSGDANHAREVAQQELDRVRGGYEEERKRRDQEVKERLQVVQLRKQMQERMNKREKKRQEIIAQEAVDLDPEGEKNLKRALALNSLTAAKMNQDKLQHKTKIDIFENAFRKIKEATGVSDVNEVIQKIVSQEGTTENLMLLTKENQAKIEALNDQKKTVKTRVEEIKYSGSGRGHRRKMVDDHEEQLTASGTRLERCRLKYERLAKMLISVKAGIEHLQDKLESIREEVDGQQIQMTDETMIDVLVECEKMIVTVLQRAKAMEYEQKLMFKGEAMEIRPDSVGITNEQRVFNQRIELPNSDDWDGDAAFNNDEGIADVDEEELTREKVKRASNQIMAQIEGKKKKKKKKDK